jgi:hypothetical protein
MQRMRRGRRLAASSVLVLLLVSCAAGSIAPSATSPEREPARTSIVTMVEVPAASPSASSSPTAATTTDPVLLQEELRAIAELVTETRGLTGGADDVVDIVGADEIAAIIEEALSEPSALAAIAAEERLYRLLGLIDQDAKLDLIYRDVLSTEVAGLYQPGTGRLYVRGDGRLSPLVRVVYAHEYAHYLQDHHFDLEAMMDAVSSRRDESLALSALIEGDASLVQQHYTLEALGLLGMIGLVLEAAQPVGQSSITAPPIVRQHLEFPYVSGLRFAMALHERAGYEAVDAAFASPPKSTSQVLHPDRYFEGIEPDPAALGDVSGALGSGWATVEEARLGEFFLRAWLVALGARQATAAGAAESWSGDAYAIMEGPGSQHVLAARLLMTRTARSDFGMALAEALDQSPDFLAHPGTSAAELATVSVRLWDAPSGVLAVSIGHPGETHIAVAPTAELATAVLRALADE